MRFLWNLAVVLLGAALVYYTLVKSRDRGPLVRRYLATVPLVGLMILSFRGGPIIALFVSMICAVLLACLWVPVVIGVMTRGVLDDMDGGTTPPDPEPRYAAIESLRSRGRYAEAIAMLLEDLQQFPQEFKAHLLLAEIHARNLSDLPAAVAVLEKVLAQPELEPQRAVYCLNLIADWQLHFARDRDAAQAALQRIGELFPGTEAAQIAAQRIAHLAPVEKLLEPEERRPLAVAHRERYLGLEPPLPEELPPEENPMERAEAIHRHLEKHPLDTALREELARLYAGSLGDMDSARHQVELLLSLPHQPSQRVAGWLHLLADLELRGGRDLDRARAALERIETLFPNQAVAETARQRIALLKKELQGLSEPGTVEYGVYEQDLGLKTSEAIRRRAMAELKAKQPGGTASDEQETSGQKKTGGNPPPA